MIGTKGQRGKLRAWQGLTTRVVAVKRPLRRVVGAVWGLCEWV